MHGPAFRFSTVENLLICCWFTSNAQPTHSFMKFLYKYPQSKFPYERLVQESRVRDREVNEFELMDTGIFDDDRYWDVFIEVCGVSVMRMGASRHHDY